jgi:PIN domain nuclease of toxin-antitoxin system
VSRGYLLDTNVLLWWLFGAERLSFHSFDVIADGSIDVFVSAVSAMEVATKHRLGKLPIASPIAGRFGEMLEEENFKALAVTPEHGDLAGSFPSPHADPWDRLLAAQAQIERLTLVSNDPQMKTFGITPYW